MNENCQDRQIWFEGKSPKEWNKKACNVIGYNSSSIMYMIKEIYVKDLEDLMLLNLEVTLDTIERPGDVLS